MAYHVRAWPYSGHITDQHVKKLRQFIQARFSQKRSKFCYPGISACSLFMIGSMINIHAPEFIAVERMIITAGALLNKKNRPLAFHLNQYRQYRKQPAKNEYDNKKCKQYI